MPTPGPRRTRTVRRILHQSASLRLAIEQLEHRNLLAAGLVSDAWLPLSVAALSPPPGNTLVRADSYESYALIREEFSAALVEVPEEFSGEKGVGVALPRPDGSLERFVVYSSSVMAPELAARYPEIRTFVGSGVDDASTTVRLDLTPAGLHAQVLGSHGSYYIDPLYDSTDKYHASYFTASVTSRGISDLEFDALHLAASAQDGLVARAAPSRAAKPVSAATASGAELRVFRIAIATTAEYTQFHGGTVADGLASVVTAINRVNGIYDNELSIRLELVANNDQLIYTNQATDPYDNNSLSSMLAQNQTNIDSIIGMANYDLGHVFGTQGGGLAFVGSAGLDNPAFRAKAQAASGVFPPTGDAFWVNIVSHEIGHQFGANHTWNGDSAACTSGQHHQSTAYEVGSGSTLMSYAGICGNDNIESTADPVFHSISFDEIVAHVDSVIPAVGTRIATNNQLPEVDAGLDLTIPAGTPFQLTAFAQDANPGDTLTYSWEQRDLGLQRDANAPDNGTGPLFRAWQPTADETRVFPRLADLVNGTTSIGETLPTIDRTLNFRLMVRDGAGGVRGDDMQVHVVDTGQTFQVATPNSTTTWPALSRQTVEWVVAGTTGSGIDTATVDILLSTDGGHNFGTVLVAATPNDGQEAIILPHAISNTARVKVIGVGNTFFDISDSNFTIAAPQPGIVAIEDDGSTLTSEGNSSDSYQIQLGTTPAGPVTVDVNAGTQAEVSSDGINFADSVSLTFDSSIPQGVTIKAVDDTLAEGAHMALVTHAISATSDPLNYPLSLTINDIVLRITDNDLARLEAVSPEGGLIARGEIHLGRIGDEGIAEYELSLPADLTIAAVITPHERVGITAEFVGLSEQVMSEPLEPSIVVPSTFVSNGGLYTLRLTADAATDFDLQLFSNTALERLTGDTSDGHELAIDASKITIAGQRRAVLGSSDATDGAHFELVNEPGRFVNIAATGTPLNLSDDGAAVISTTVGNSFFPAGSVTVGNNGAIVSGGFDPTVPFNNGSLPSSTFGNALVPFWDDLVGPSPGNVFWEERFIDGARVLIVQWHERQHFDAVGEGDVTFQVQVFETGNVLARFVYEDVQLGDPILNGGASATIGYQADSTSAIQYSFETASLSDGDVLELRLFSPDVDEYEIDFTGAAGLSLDIFLTGLAGLDLARQSLELLSPDGTTVLAAGSPDPISSDVLLENYDLGIVDFVLPAEGIYTARVASSLSGEYSIVVADSVTLETEPNDSVASGLQRAIAPNQPGLGHLDVDSDLFDIYTVQVGAGERLTVETSTLYDAPSLLPVNSLNPQIEVLDTSGVVLAADFDSASDGKNAIVQFAATDQSTLLVRVGATSGAGEYSLSVAVDDQPTGLFVTSLVPTSSGFVIDFSEALDASSLNLFDSTAVGLGDADVVVSGAIQGPIAGSLIVGSAGNQVTFVKTDGPLVDDVYSISLRSGASGFRGVTGNQLDGNADGILGDDYLAAITAGTSSGTITVSVPDFVRGPGQQVHLPASSSAGIPVTLSDGDGVRAVDLRISYDPELLEISAASVEENLPAGASVILNALTPGLAIIVFFSPNALPAGPTDLLHLTATVPATNADTIYRRAHVLDLHSITISDGDDNEFSTSDDDAVHLATYFGDVSGNGRINASDAAQLGRVAALLDTGFAATLLIDPSIVGDVSGNRRLNGSDASLVAQVAALLPVEQIPPIPPGVFGQIRTTQGPAKTVDQLPVARLPKLLARPIPLTGKDRAWQFERRALGETREKPILDHRIVDDLLRHQEWLIGWSRRD